MTATEPDPTERRSRPRLHIARGPLVGAVAGAVIVVDQLTKAWALSRLSDGRVVEVVGSFRFTLTWNTGASFSFGEDLQVGPYIGVLALGVVGWLLFSGHTATRLGAIAAGLVSGGAVGNLIDRALRSGRAGTPADGFMGGAVVDFIDVADWWAVFNVADMGVVGGAIALVVASILMGDPRDDAGDDADDEAAPVARSDAS